VRRELLAFAISTAATAPAIRADRQTPRRTFATRWRPTGSLGPPSAFASEIPDDAQFRETLAAIGARPRAAREEGTTSCAVRACCTQGGQFACHEHDGFETCATLRRNVECYGDASPRNIRAVGLDAWLTAGDRRWSRSALQPTDL